MLKRSFWILPRYQNPQRSGLCTSCSVEFYCIYVIELTSFVRPTILSRTHIIELKMHMIKQTYTVLIILFAETSFFGLHKFLVMIDFKGEINFHRLKFNFL